MLPTRLALPALLLCTLSAAPAVAQGSMEIVVNIPAGRLDVLQGGTRVRSFPVSVGTAAHATPTAEASVRRVVWNPTWTPPDAPWARKEKPAGPGWNNPMGRVKMHLFRDYYVHGTPARNEARLGRPASHGCIRMRNADVVELARLVMDADGAPLSAAQVDRLAANPGATHEVALSGRVRVRVEYRLTEVTDDSLVLLPDVYARHRGGYAARVAEELRAAGHDPAPVLATLAAATAPTAPLRMARDARGVRLLPLPQIRLAMPAADAAPATRLALQ